ncbi:MAG: methyltransferase domain-containing protein [bacterium]|nr:methyltransferase domain-containing protein [bacterium]
MKQEIPKGYSIQKIKRWGDFLNHQRKSAVVESFRLTDRTFTQIDHYLGSLPSQMIEYLIGRNGGKIRIGDIAGGRKSLCAKEMAEKYKGRVTVANIDLLHNPDRFRLPNLIQIAGDVTDLPLQTKSLDFALCYQLFPGLEDDGNYTKGVAAVAEIARTLKEGGVALINEDYLCRRCFFSQDKTIKNLAAEANIFMSRRQGNNSRPGEMVTGGHSSFLMIEKRPQDFNLLRIRERIIGHI